MRMSNQFVQAGKLFIRLGSNHDDSLGFRSAFIQGYFHFHRAYNDGGFSQYKGSIQVNEKGSSWFRRGVNSLGHNNDSRGGARWITVDL